MHEDKYLECEALCEKKSIYRVTQMILLREHSLVGEFYTFVVYKPLIEASKEALSNDVIQILTIVLQQLLFPYFCATC